VSSGFHSFLCQVLIEQTTDILNCGPILAIHRRAAEFDPAVAKLLEKNYCFITVVILPEVHARKFVLRH
jgi:hypothetical protein